MSVRYKDDGGAAQQQNMTQSRSATRFVARPAAVCILTSPS